MTTTCSPRVRRNLESQGFSPGEDARALQLSRAARFQPALTLALVVTGLLLPARQLEWFGALAGLAWLGVAVPATNVFDLLWRLAFTTTLGWPGLGAPPAPRRFSQGMGASFLTAIAAFFYAGMPNAALGTGIAMALAASAVTFGDLCIGSLIYGALFARRATP